MQVDCLGFRQILLLLAETRQAQSPQERLLDGLGLGWQKLPQPHCPDRLGYPNLEPRLALVLELALEPA